MRPHGSSGQFFWFGWKDIIETKFQAKNEVNWPCISLKLDTSNFMCFNRFLHIFAKSGINMKYNRLLGQGISFAQAGNCFFSFLYPSSFYPKWLDVWLRGPKGPRQANVRGHFGVTLIKNSWTGAHMRRLSDFGKIKSKFLSKLSVSPKIK